MGSVEVFEMGVFVGGQTWRVGYVVEEIAEAEYGNGNAKAPPDVGVVEDGFQLRSAMLFGFHGRLVVIDFVEFDFVGDGGVGGDAVGTGDEAVGEVEAVFAAGVHELDAGEEALEHGFAEHVDDGFALAVGLLDELVVDEVDAFEVEADALADGGAGAVALAEDLDSDGCLQRPDQQADCRTFKASGYWSQVCAETGISYYQYA